MCQNLHSSEEFAFPSQKMIDAWRGQLNTLLGFENTQQDGRFWVFNFVLSNGQRSEQRDVGVAYYNHVMPKDKKVKSVDIFFINCIAGFQFLVESLRATRVKLSKPGVPKTYRVYNP